MNNTHGGITRGEKRKVRLDEPVSKKRKRVTTLFEMFQKPDSVEINNNQANYRKIYIKMQDPANNFSLSDRIIQERLSWLRDFMDKFEYNTYFQNAEGEYSLDVDGDLEDSGFIVFTEFYINEEKTIGFHEEVFAQFLKEAIYNEAFDDFDFDIEEAIFLPDDNEWGPSMPGIFEVSRLFFNYENNATFSRLSECHIYKEQFKELFSNLILFSLDEVVEVCCSRYGATFEINLKNLASLYLKGLNSRVGEVKTFILETLSNPTIFNRRWKHQQNLSSDIDYYANTVVKSVDLFLPEDVLSILSSYLKKETGVKKSSVKPLNP